MNLRKYLATRTTEEREAFWLRLGRPHKRDRIYIYSFNTGARKPSPVLARQISAASDGIITLETLRPDIWGTVTPTPSRGKKNGRKVGKVNGKKKPQRTARATS